MITQGCLTWACKSPRSERIRAGGVFSLWRELRAALGDHVAINEVVDSRDRASPAPPTSTDGAAVHSLERQAPTYQAWQCVLGRRRRRFGSTARSVRRWPAVGGAPQAWTGSCARPRGSAVGVKTPGSLGAAGWTGLPISHRLLLAVSR